MNGKLYIVATPIGNLEDISGRALRTLREADRIACEDTRHTRRLLDYYGIDKPLISFHEHNERDRSEELLDRIRSGESIALVSDAGTPLVSDPGYRLVEAAAHTGVTVVPIPGPSAVITALAASGLTTDSFYFGGFLPSKPGQRKRQLEAVSELNCVVIFYEAPHRLVESLRDIAALFGDREVVIARELTKIHEEFVRGSAEEVAAVFHARESVKGEVTILIAKPREREKDAGSVPEVFERYLRLGMSRMEAMKATARDCGLSKREVYAELTEAAERKQPESAEQ